MKIKIISFFIILISIFSCNLINDTPDQILDQRFGKVMDLLLPYADANGIEYNKI